MRRLSSITAFADRGFKLTLSLCLVICVLLFFFWSIHWPLVGDASLIHYICFLMDHGMAPYRDLGDMNMPGVYIIEWIVMHTFGMGDIAWRIFDFTLMASAAAAILTITLPDWFAGVFAASLFILVHGRDGLGQGGQRDLTMAVCLLVSIAFLFIGVRKIRSLPFALFGLFSGIAATIKPTILPFGAVLLVLALVTLRKRNQQAFRFGVCATLAFLIGPVVAFCFLLKKHSMGAFLEGLRSVVPYYASLGHKPLSFLLSHSISPLMPLVIIWVVLIALTRPKLTWERTALLCGVGFGLVSYVVQARGYPYYRYPLLGFLLPLMAMDFIAALQVRGKAMLARCSSILALAGVLVGALVIAPASIFLIRSYEPHEDFISSLQQNLNELGGLKLSGRVQCVDSISGCGTTLYKMRLVQSTGVLSDFLLFGPDTTPVIHATREEFRREIGEAPPDVIVVSGWLHIDGPGDYEKLERWPTFKAYLANRYVLKTEWTPSRPNHWWSRKQWPDGYRVYVLRANQDNLR